jgi:hypothetical protein
VTDRCDWPLCWRPTFPVSDRFGHQDPPSRRRLSLAPPERELDLPGRYLAKSPAAHLIGCTAVLGWPPGKTNRDRMRATLERIKAEVE